MNSPIYLTKSFNTKSQSFYSTFCYKPDDIENPCVNRKKKLINTFNKKGYSITALYFTFFNIE